jgi:hypothetical protein
VLPDPLLLSLFLLWLFLFSLFQSFVGVSEGLSGAAAASLFKFYHASGRVVGARGLLLKGASSHLTCGVSGL